MTGFISSNFTDTTGLMKLLGHPAQEFSTPSVNVLPSPQIFSDLHSNRQSVKILHSLLDSLSCQTQTQSCPVTVSLIGSICSSSVLKILLSTSPENKTQFFLYNGGNEIELSEGVSRNESNWPLSMYSQSLVKKQKFFKNIFLKKKTEWKTELTDMKIAVIGVGAIGCEVLKLLSQTLALSPKGKGSIVVVDPDTIERSNLNRQVLFR